MNRKQRGTRKTRHAHLAYLTATPLTGALTNTHSDDGECMRWVTEGQCRSNPAFMLASCALGCSTEDIPSLEPTGRDEDLDLDEDLDPTERAASRRRLAWSFASGVHSVARTRLAEFLHGSAAASAMAHTLYYPWAPRPGERQQSTEYLRTLCDSAFVFCPRGGHEDTWRFYEAAACGAIPIVTDRRYWARFMPADVVELLLETRCDFALSTTDRRRDDITTCSDRSFEATVTHREREGEGEAGRQAGRQAGRLAGRQAGR